MHPSTIRYGQPDQLRFWSLQNSQQISDWMHSDRDRSTTLSAAWRSDLETALGAPQQTWTGGSENRSFAVWRVEEEGMPPLWILQGKPGVIFKVEHPRHPHEGDLSEQETDAVIDFLKRLETALNEGREISPATQLPRPGL